MSRYKNYTNVELIAHIYSVVERLRELEKKEYLSPLEVVEKRRKEKVIFDLQEELMKRGAEDIPKFPDLLGFKQPA